MLFAHCGIRPGTLIVQITPHESRSTMIKAANGEAMQRRMLVVLLAILVVLYGAAAVQAPLLADTRGEWLAAGLCVVGLAAAIGAAPRGARYLIAVSCLCAAPVITMVFHRLIVAQVWSLIPLMFAAVYVRTWHRPAVARTVAVALSAAAVAALWLAPAPAPWLWSVSFPVCIVGAAEVIGVVHATLYDAALRDPLTGVWNRAGVDRWAGDLVERARRRNELVAVLVLDVDDFKGVNDRDGHAAGDAALAQLARRLVAQSPDQAVIGRVGGDEFVVVAAGVDEASARRIAAGLDGPVGVTSGVAVGRPVDGDAFTTLLVTADEDLYRAKRDRRPDRR